LWFCDQHLVDRNFTSAKPGPGRKACILIFLGQITSKKNYLGTRLLNSIFRKKLFRASCRCRNAGITAGFALFADLGFFLVNVTGCRLRNASIATSFALFAVLRLSAQTQSQNKSHCE
jgi:hypothetical protein